jgi:hypothetical protein
VRCFAICTVLYLVPLQYRIVAGCCLKSNLQIRAPGNGWTLFSLAAHPCPLDCSCRAESRANKYMRSHPPAYSHLTSTCTSILRLITCSHRNTNIQPTVLQHQFPYDDLAILPVVHPRVTVSTARSGWVCASQQFHSINAQRSFSWELIKFSNNC